MKSLETAMLAFCKANEWEKAFQCVELEWKESKNYRLVATFRDLVRNSVTEKTLKLYRASYDLTARDVFDDFMLALEWNRPAEEQFWLPRRDKLKGVCEALQSLEEGKLDELFLSLPLRVGKTTLILFFLLWVMLRDSERSNLYSSYTESVVNTFYGGLIEILDDPYTYRWKEIFPGSCVASTNAKDNLLNLDRKKRYASLTARSLYGTLNGACDCNGYLIGDDLHSGIEEALNKALLDKAWGRVTNNLIPRAKEGAKLLWIGTRWSLYDCIARRIELLQHDPSFERRRFKVFNLPALDEDEHSNFEYLYGVGFSADHYKRIRATFERSDDIASFLAQYMGEPVERAGTLFDPSVMRYFNGVLPSDVEPDKIFMTVDPAWGGGDYVAAPCIVQYGFDLYVVDVVYNNGDKKITQPKIVQMAIKNNVGIMYIEGTRVTSSYAEGVSDLLNSKGYKLNLQTTTKHWGGGGGKAQRIYNVAPDIKERMIFLTEKKRSKEYQQFMMNVFAFTIEGKVKHDDAPDSLAMAVQMDNSFVKAEIYKRPF